MGFIFRLFMIGFLGTLLAACSPWNPSAIKLGESTLDSAQRNLGQPESEWRNASGQRVLHFSNLPNGTQTFALTLDEQDIVVDMQQLISTENFQRVSPGMSQDEIHQLLGRPIGKQQFSLKEQEVWDWPFQTGGQEMRFHVHFNMQGKVVETSSMPLQNGG